MQGHLGKELDPRGPRGENLLKYVFEEEAKTKVIVVDCSKGQRLIFGSMVLQKDQPPLAPHQRPVSTPYPPPLET